MSERKQTPDILGALLSGEESANGEDVAGMKTVSTPLERRVRSKPRPVRQEVQTAEKPTVQKRGPDKKARFEYRIVSFQNHQGWRVRFIDGQEIQDWTGGMLLGEYLKEAGEDGWELAVAACGEGMYASGDKYQLYFIRRK